MSVAATEHARYAAAAAYRCTTRPWSDPTVLLLHGLGGSSVQLWSSFPPDGPLSLLAPDARGHGDTDLVGGPDAFTFDGLARDQLALLDALGVGRVLVAGVSMGAGVAAALALRAPERVAGLLLVRPAWLDTSYPAHLEPLRRLGEELQQADVDAVRSRLLGSDELASLQAESPAAAASLVGQLDDPRARDRSVRLRRMPASTPFARLADLGRLTCPVTVVGARRDPVHPLAVAEAWAQAVPGSRSVVLPSRDEDPPGYRRALDEAAAAFVGRTGGSDAAGR